MWPEKHLFLSLLQKISPKDRFNGKPVFSREPLTGNMEVNKSQIDNLLGLANKVCSNSARQAHHCVTLHTNPSLNFKL